MKKCPLCGNEYEVENVCPICNILLIDTDSNRAVSNETAKERKRREEREAKEQAVEQKKAQAKEKAAQMKEKAVQSAGQMKDKAVQSAAQVSEQGIQMDSKKLMIIGGVVAIVILLVIVLKFAFGGKDDASENMFEENQVVTEETVGVVEEVAPETAKDVFANTELVTFETDMFSFELPAYWYEVCNIDEGDTYVEFYQKKSLEYGGTVLAVAAVPRTELDYMNNYAVIKEVGSLAYVLEYPTEVCYDIENEDAASEYRRLLKDEHYIFSSFEAYKTESAVSGDYIIEGSDTRIISDSELDRLTKEEVALARNEIYARHGRMFNTDSIQAYFNSKSWYHGTIAPESFTDGMLTEIERKNVQIIAAYEQRHGYR